MSTAETTSVPDVIVDTHGRWYTYLDSSTYRNAVTREQHDAATITPSELWLYAGPPSLDASADILIFYGIDRAGPHESRDRILITPSLHTPTASAELRRRGVDPNAPERHANPDWMVDVDGVTWERFEIDRYSDADGNDRCGDDIDARTFGYRGGPHARRIGWRGMVVVTGATSADDLTIPRTVSTSPGTPPDDQP